jgi:DNA-binding response OmpR family regulator
MKILVVDDEGIIRSIVAHRLSEAGHEVVEAEDGQAAWELFQRTPFPVIITDVIMPRMDGLDLIRKIRSANVPGYTYVIILTVLAERKDLLEGQQAGADDYLTKPFNNVELLARIALAERFLNLHARLQETLRQAESSPSGGAGEEGGDTPV